MTDVEIAMNAERMETKWSTIPTGVTHVTKRLFHPPSIHRRVPSVMFFSMDRRQSSLKRPQFLGLLILPLFTNSAFLLLFSNIMHHFWTYIDKSEREFPSLGAPSQQQSTAAQSMWSNPSIRAPSQQGQAGIQRNVQSSLQQQQQQQQSDEISHFGPGSEAYRFGGTTNQLAGLAQTPTQGQGGDDFPPLGDNDQRSSLLSGFATQPGAGLQNSRLGLDQGPELALRGLGDRNVRFNRWTSYFKVRIVLTTASLRLAAEL